MSENFKNGNGALKRLKELTQIVSNPNIPLQSALEIEIEELKKQVVRSYDVIDQLIKRLDQCQGSCHWKEPPRQKSPNAARESNND